MALIKVKDEYKATLYVIDNGVPKKYTYIRVGGRDGKYINGEYWYKTFYVAKPDKQNVYVTRSMGDYLQKKYDINSSESVYTSTPPAEGTDVYLAPSAQIPAEDVRKHYNIKKDITKCSYIIAGKSIPIRYRYVSDNTLLFDNEGVAVALDGSVICSLNGTKDVQLTQEGLDRLNQLLGSSLTGGTYNTDSIYCISNDVGVSRQRMEDFVVKLIENNITTPFITPDKLTLGSQVPLTFDALKTFVAAVSLNYYQDGAKEKGLAALQAMNQTNWRNYMGTLSFIWASITRRFRSVLSEMTISTVPIAVKPLFKELSSNIYAFKTKDDYEMCLAWLQNGTGITETKFLTYEQLKEVDRSIPTPIYNFYSVCCKVRPKTWEEYNKRK